MSHLEFPRARRVLSVSTGDTCDTFLDSLDGSDEEIEAETCESLKSDTDSEMEDRAAHIYDENMSHYDLPIECAAGRLFQGAQPSIIIPPCIDDSPEFILSNSIPFHDNSKGETPLVRIAVHNERKRRIEADLAKVCTLPLFSRVRTDIMHRQRRMTQGARSSRARILHHPEKG